MTSGDRARGIATTSGGALDDAEILQAIAAVAREHLHWEGEITRELRLVETLELDSLRLLTLVVELENRFRICLDEGSEAGIETVADLIAIVRGKLEERPADRR